MKGYIYTLEILISISLIVVTSVFAFKFAPNRDIDNMDVIKDKVFNSLEYLDQKGDLRIIVNNLNRNALDKNLTLLLSGFNVDSDICSDACITPILPNRPVISVEYYVSGYQDNYLRKKIKVWVWRKF